MIKTRAIILHRYPYSDSSWIVKALTEECGIVSFIVKGGKRKESPFKGALDPLSLSEVVFRHNPGTELQFVKEASILEWHKNLRENLLNLAKAQVMAEIVLRYAPQGVPLQDEFSLLLKSFNQLENPDNSPNPQSNIFAQFLLETCDMWGYHLELTTCSRCDCQLSEAPADFHPESGSIICKSCLGVESPRARSETTQGLWNLLNGFEISNEQFTENAILAYLRHHIGFLKEINSLQFLNETRKLYLG